MKAKSVGWHLSDKNPSPTLLGLATVTRYRAQKLMAWKLVVQFVASVLSIGALAHNQTAAALLAICGLVAMISSFITGTRAKHWHEISREAQRLALLEDAYGKIVETFQVVELRKRIGVALESAARKIDYTQPYYTGSKPTGNIRLRENIQQSTFWSRNLLELYEKRLFAVVLITIAIVALGAFLFLVVLPGAGRLIMNPYVVCLGAFTVLSGLVGYLETLLSCHSGVDLLLAVDQRLDKADIDSLDVLLANFADYCVASIIAPPIPFYIYKKNQTHLREMWDQRLKAKNGGGKQLLIPTQVSVELDDRKLPPWVNKQDLLDIIQLAADELACLSEKRSVSRVTVGRLAGLSGVPVFDIKVYSDKMLWRQLVLRLHRSAHDAKHELDIVKKISQENADVITYVPFDEPFISRGALFFYHSNIQTDDQLVYAHEFVLEYIRSGATEFDNYFTKMLYGLKSVSRVYDRITGKYDLVTFQEMLPSLMDSLPPTFIIDLRSARYNATNGDLRLIQDRDAPQENERIVASPFNAATAEWVQHTFTVKRVGSYSGDVYEIDIEVL